MRGSPQKRADRLRREIEREILSGALAPGDRLDEKSLAERFAVSRTPVREALSGLAASGLVELRPHQGAVVARLTIPRMIEMFEVMAELEGLCARLASRRMTAEERAQLQRIHAECGDAVRAGDDPDAYYVLNKQFHETIYAGSHNGFLEETTRSIRNRLSPYRRHQLHLSGRVRNSHAEHGAVVDAILRGDADAADALMRRHIAVQGDTFADFLSALPAAYAERATS